MAVQTGQIVFRQWQEGQGLREVKKSFTNLEELFQLCIATDENLLVDRVYIHGTTSDGAARKLALVFQSVTILDDGNKE